MIDMFTLWAVIRFILSMILALLIAKPSFKWNKGRLCTRVKLVDGQLAHITTANRLQEFHQREPGFVGPELRCCLLLFSMVFSLRCIIAFTLHEFFGKSYYVVAVESLPFMPSLFGKMLPIWYTDSTETSAELLIGLYVRAC
jgi:hypothetical protein